MLRCNHCTDAPCVTICPTVALYKRPDGIVDFNGDRCIGCKSCMQACPYDALYIDPNTHTAAKCHFCAHRTEIGLQPACVVVCPEQAIVAGDLDDPMSRIAQLVARETTIVRRPEQGTKPNVYYVGADDAALTPGVPSQPTQYMWSQVHPDNVRADAYEMKGGDARRQDSHGVRRGPRAALGLAGGGVSVDEGDRGRRAGGRGAAADAGASRRPAAGRGRARAGAGVPAGARACC